jgi:hypothetical protein
VLLPRVPGEDVASSRGGGRGGGDGVLLGMGLGMSSLWWQLAGTAAVAVGGGGGGGGDGGGDGAWGTSAPQRQCGLAAPVPGHTVSFKEGRFFSGRSWAS